jgi:hypothetical protein
MARNLDRLRDTDVSQWTSRPAPRMQRHLTISWHSSIDPGMDPFDPTSDPAPEPVEQRGEHRDRSDLPERCPILAGCDDRVLVGVLVFLILYFCAVWLGIRLAG